MSRSKKSKSPAKRKLSEMILEVADGFIRVGKTTGERQNRLNAACTAWNIACASPESRSTQVDRYMQSYRQFNINSIGPPGNFLNIRKDLELLVERKLQLFPDDKRLVVNATVVPNGSTYRIEVVSATLQ